MTDTELIDQLILYVYNMNTDKLADEITELDGIMALLLRNHLIENITVNGETLPIEPNDNFKNISIKKLKFCSSPQYRPVYGGARVLAFTVNIQLLYMYLRVIINTCITIEYSAKPSERVPALQYYSNIIFTVTNTADVDNIVLQLPFIKLIVFRIKIQAYYESNDIIDIFDTIMDKLPTVSCVYIFQDRIDIADLVKRCYNEGDLYSLDTIYKFLCFEPVYKKLASNHKSLILELKNMTLVKKSV